MKSNKVSISSRQMSLTAPIDRWDEAIPLGNGLMGVLVWGDDACIRFSLDRGDLWDLRTAKAFERPEFTFETMKKLIRRKDTKKINELFDKPYRESAYPTKLPGGRIELKFRKKTKISRFHLDMNLAQGQVDFQKGKIKTFCSATDPVCLVKIEGPEASVNIVPPAFGEKYDPKNTDSFVSSLGRMEYPAPKQGKSGNFQWTLQECAQNFKYAIVCGTKKVGHATLLAFTIRTTEDSENPVEAGKEIVMYALNSGFEVMRKPHEAWWKKFWSQSSVTLPDKDIERQYDLTQYFYGSASRKGAPPMPLQGVWTADEGTLPPWKGDYHNDLNTQLTYWAYQAANHPEEGESFLDFMWDLLPKFQEFARNFYKTNGAAIPGVMTLEGKMMGGWPQYSFSLTSGAWVAQAFHLHWRYMMDEKFLVERAYPFCSEIGRFAEAILKKDGSGKLVLPLSSSPEIHNNQLNAWLKPNSNYDLSLVRWLFGALAEMAKAMKHMVEAKRWEKVFSCLPELAVGEKGLKISPDEDLTESHRHHAHLMAIYPLGLLTMDDVEQAKVIRDSLYHLDTLGTAWWVGYSFSWLSCMAARCRMPEKALAMLETFYKGFVARNGFHLNGDFKDQGFCAFKYRPFTLEGNFAAAQAVHEMLLQSHGGIVQIFPVLPESWHDVSFNNLRAEGAFQISAERKNGKNIRVRIVAEKGGLLRLRDPFANEKVQWSRKGIKKQGHDYVCTLKSGELLEGNC
jgi:alpha-L-fucosidase 2